jgi:hypothetical protein
MGGTLLMTAVWFSCGEEAPLASASAPAPVSVAPEPPAPKTRPEGELPGILMSQAQFKKGDDGKPVPGPAKLVLWRTDGTEWWDEIVEDPAANVFHKTVDWRDGLLSISAGSLPNAGAPPPPGQVKYWTKTGGAWTGKVLWERAWAGRFQRLRDFEIADLDGDGRDDLAIATHDRGVVAVLSEGADGTWSAAEMDETPDTFVHEIEVGDVDGDGKKEFYCTPSGRNKASGESQPGAVARYDYKGSGYVRSWVAQWAESHAKEILVADVDGNGRDELYVVREGHVEKVGKAKSGKTELKDPVKILRMDWNGKGYDEVVVASLEGEAQTRFLLAGDVDHDGRTDLVAAAMDTGLWLLKRRDDGTFDASVIDANSGGFEHATDLADLDGDGKIEVYVAADKQKEFRRYLWNGTAWDKTVIAPIPERHITWSLQDGRF